jgi:5-methyltetrahydropteroyltriglutamate--homocysteine methyltransferase
MSKVRICPLSYSGTRSYRIIMFAELVGQENAGTDCSRVHPQTAWAKLRALRDGVATASKKLWN